MAVTGVYRGAKGMGSGLSTGKMKYHMRPIVHDEESTGDEGGRRKRTGP